MSKLYSNSFLVSLNSVRIVSDVRSCRNLAHRSCQRRRLGTPATEQRNTTFQLETFAVASSRGETTMVSSYPVTPVTVDIAIANDHVPHRGVGDEVSFCAESSVDTLADFEHRRKCVYDTLIACIQCLSFVQPSAHGRPCHV